MVVWGVIFKGFTRFENTSSVIGIIFMIDSAIEYGRSTLPSTQKHKYLCVRACSSVVTEPQNLWCSPRRLLSAHFCNVCLHMSEYNSSFNRILHVLLSQKFRASWKIIFQSTDLWIPHPFNQAIHVFQPEDLLILNISQPGDLWIPNMFQPTDLWILNVYNQRICAT